MCRPACTRSTAAQSGNWGEQTGRAAGASARTGGGRRRLTANRSSRHDLPTPESPISRSCGWGQGGGLLGAGGGGAAAVLVDRAGRPPTLNRKSYSLWCAIVGRWLAGEGASCAAAALVNAAWRVRLPGRGAEPVPTGDQAVQAARNSGSGAAAGSPPPAELAPNAAPACSPALPALPDQQLGGVTGQCAPPRRGQQRLEAESRPTALLGAPPRPSRPPPAVDRAAERHAAAGPSRGLRPPSTAAAVGWAARPARPAAR